MADFNVPYSIRMMVQLIRRYLNNTFVGDSFSISTNEIALHIWKSASDKIVQLAYKNAQMEAALSVAEAFLETYSIPVTEQDPITQYWIITLPQPPISLPLGYSINDAYFVDTTYGKSQPIFLIKAKRVSYRNFMPMPTGIRGWVEGLTMWLVASNNMSLLNGTARVSMPTARISDLDAPFHLPDDIVTAIYDEVVTKLSERFKEPRSDIKSGEPAGNTQTKS